MSDRNEGIRPRAQVAGLALAAACVVASPLLAPMVTATLLALMSWPIVAWLRLRGVAYPLGAAVVVLAMMGALAIIAWGLAGPLGDLVDREHRDSDRHRRPPEA